MRREKIIDVIKHNPGISYNEIIRKTNLSNGVLTHYLIQLTDEKKIVKFGGIRSKYFTSNISKKDREIISILRNKTNIEILKIILKKEEEGVKFKTDYEQLDPTTIAKIIKKSKSTVCVSLKKLQNSNIIERKIMNKKLKLTNDIEYVVTNRNECSEFLSKHKL